MFGNNRKKFDKRIATLLVFLILISSFSPVFARKAEAFIFTDWVNFAVNAVTSFASQALWIKEYALDAVAYQIVNLVVEKIAASTVNWINSGFKGSPAFVTDPESYFQNLGDKIAGQYIFSNPKLDFLCGPISAKIKLALDRAYLNERSWQCTLTDALGNMDDFMGDFERGGWDKFFELTQRQQNSPLGIYLQAESELAQEIANKKDEKDKELSWGRGFFSFKECVKRSEGSEGQMTDDFVNTTYDAEGNEVQTVIPGFKLPDIPPKCLEERTVTPGNVISEQLNKTLGLGGERLAVSDEINEIMSALLNQLISQVVGGIGRGLRGLSEPDPVSGQIFTSQLSNSDKDAQVTNYFNISNSSVSNVLNSPPYDPYVCRNNPNLPECLPPSDSPAGSCAPTDTLCQTCKNNPTLPQCQFAPTP